MKSGDITTSERLKKLLSVLRYGGRQTTSQIQAETGSMAVHSDVCDLRGNGFPVKCRYQYTDPDTGRRVFTYEL